MTNILTICGSLRKKSYNRGLMNVLPSVAPAGMTFKESPSIAAIPHYDADDQNSTGFPASVTAFADAIRQADGIIIVTPEYNWTIPGTLKNALDWVSRMKDQPFAGKPVALQSATQGPLGGARVQYHLRQALVFLDAHGVDLDAATRVLGGGLAGSTVLDRKAAAMRDHAFAPGFRIDLHHKDMGIVTAAAREAGVAIPLGAHVAQLVASLRAQGHGGLDHSALLLQVEQLSGRAS